MIGEEFRKYDKWGVMNEVELFDCQNVKKLRRKIGELVSGDQTNNVVGNIEALDGIDKVLADYKAEKTGRAAEVWADNQFSNTTTDIEKKKSDDKSIMLNAGGIDAVNATGLIQRAREGIKKAVEGRNYSGLVETLADTYGLLLKRVEAGSRAEMEQGIMSEQVSKDTENVLKYGATITKLLLEVRKIEGKEDMDFFNKGVTIEKLKRTNEKKKVDNVKIYEILGNMTEEEQKKVRKLLNSGESSTNE